jgi:hypothetical protein
VAPRLNPEAELAYYTVANALHFPGAVALLNSLRLLGDEAPFFVVDCGLTDSQRTRLSSHVTLVEQYRGLHPVLQKATAPLAYPAEIMVLLDADVIVSKPLVPLFDEAARGHIIAFENDWDRFFPEWSSLGLGVPRRRRYVNAGHLIFSAETASDLLPLFVELQEQLEPADTHYGGGTMSNPFYFADQDVLNVILSTQYDGRVTTIDHRLAPVPPFTGLRITDLRRLSCSYGDGVSPYLLHHILKKPWLAPLEQNVYSQLFRRVVSGDDVTLRLTARDLPLRLSASRFAPVDRWRVSLQLGTHRRIRGKLGIRPVLARHARRITSRRAS